jgi:suppressor of G2 allele of SKP1
LIATAATSSSSGPSYPSSSRNKINWSKLEKQVLEEEEKAMDTKEPNAGGDTELNKLFQKLYAGATDEQRMAMMKSYQESNGTALSTDWDSVKKAPVETKPPDVRTPPLS